MTRYQYNHQVDPPAPFIHVKISRVDGGGASVVTPALVDSGADQTVVPQSLIDELGLPQSGTVETAGLDNVGATMITYGVRMGVHDLAPFIMEVIGAPGEHYVLLGRDVLNRYRVTLDGPQLLCIVE